MKLTQPRSIVKKTLVTLKIDISRWNMTALQALLRGIERHHGSLGFTMTAGNIMVWQIYIDSFDPLYCFQFHFYYRQESLLLLSSALFL